MMNISINIKQNSQTLHEYSYLLRAHRIHIVCLQHGWFWNNNI